MTPERLHECMRAFPFWMLRDLARGPCEEPHCGVCQVFNIVDEDPPSVSEGMNIWQMMTFAECALEVWDWHDTNFSEGATSDERDKEMFRRCLVIYAAALSEMTRRADLKQRPVIVPPKWLTDDIEGFKYVVEFYATPEAATLLRVA